MFDKNPLIAPGGNGYPTNPVYFDTYGRTWRVGMRVRFGNERGRRHPARLPPCRLPPPALRRLRLRRRGTC